MNTGRANSDLPAGLTEADLIDLADGVLSREREGVVLAALKQHPEMGLLAKQFRADRAMVTSLTEVRAPSGLAEGIEARLTAAALRDLASQSHEAPRPIRMSQVQIREPSVLRLLMDSPWTRIACSTPASMPMPPAMIAVGRVAADNSESPQPNGSIASPPPTTATDSKTS